MDCVNADSDHSMTWEDFFGSTSDLTPSLMGIYDSLRQPSEKSPPEVSRFDLTAKDTRNEPPLKTDKEDKMTDEKTNNPPKDTTKKIPGSVRLPGPNKSALYNIRTKMVSDSSVTDTVNRISSETAAKTNVKTKMETKTPETLSAYDTLSPNVKRMISSATETSTLKFKKSVTGARASVRGHRSNIPLVGATSKISQSGVDILPSVEIYDQPTVTRNATKITNNDEDTSPKESPIKVLKPNFRLNVQETYDVPNNNKPVNREDSTAGNKTAFESLSLPYIDQSIELTITTNDREFDTKVNSKDNSPQNPKTSPQRSPVKLSNSLNGETNSLNRKEYTSKNSSPAKQLSKSEPYPDAIGSTGNLKSCVIPEKEAPRLNPPTVEVTRPLSMSSIASSSSTSSSGAQNKGGVNSAYLASIESLDDHSDADMTSANGSSNFMNNADILNKGTSEERSAEKIPREQFEPAPGLTQLERVCAEIVHTENVYVRDLQQVVEGYLHVWRRDATFSEEELTELFNNIEDIYNFNRTLCEELNTCQLDATCIARCFVKNTTGFAVYTSYCTGYPRTMERLAALASSPTSAREFRERQLALGHPLPLASYLLKPVQRILKYHLLLQNVVKQCASSEIEYALEKMTGIAQHIDDMKRRHEHAVRVQEIQSLLYGWSGADLTTYGELCAEGIFRVFGAKAQRHVFLFDSMLLVTKSRDDAVLAYKTHIMCNNLMLVESISGAPLSFHVIPWDCPRAQLTLAASSRRQKREWTLLLKRVILENYNAVIPSHARQLVMELGQNKTDDDILAEKSHNLITQASMRKQLSAPEYLEKRKLERDRRKAFENGMRSRLKKPNRKYTVPNSRTETRNECDCSQVSLEKGTDFTCDNCYIDLCSECETETTKDTKNDKCHCKNDDSPEKCPECDKSLHYIDSGSVEHLERKTSVCKCTDFKSSQESFGREFSNTLNKTRWYHSSDNIVGYTDSKSKENLNETNNSMTNVRSAPKTCLKCVKIKENIVTNDDVKATRNRKSRCIEGDKQTNTLRSKSKDDPQRIKLSKIGGWRRKSEPGLQQNPVAILSRKSQDDTDKDKGNEKIEFECRNCGSNKISRKSKTNDAMITSDHESETQNKTRQPNTSHLEIKMYNTKHVPKKISKLKKNRAKSNSRYGNDTAKFYTDFSTDVSTENILHISESNDSLNVEKSSNVAVTTRISKDEDIDEETYKKLIEKTDSFKKNELEKVKFLNKQKVINETSEDVCEDKKEEEEATEEEEQEQPLEQIISQLLLQNREFQKLLKKQQQRNSASRRHQRLLKSYSNPEQENPPKPPDAYVRTLSVDVTQDPEQEIKPLSPPAERDDGSEDDHIYETLRVENRIEDTLHNIDTKSKSIQHTSKIARPKRLPSPPDPNKNLSHTISKTSNPESDYVYLSFDKLNEDVEGIYDVPVKNNEKVKQIKHEGDYYVTVDKQVPVTTADTEDHYDSILEVCKRKKEPTTSSTGEYLPMSPEQKSPIAPEIWVSRQKEHFNVSRDRKSGSLPRSFQLPTNEDINMSTFKSKPNTNSKTYLNRDGKVLSIDRPFTIASDQSELSFDDVENYMPEGDVLKLNNKQNFQNIAQNISQSTLELEREIDTCYKNHFEGIKLGSKDENIDISQSNINSTTSSCEALSPDKDKIKGPEIIHPEHKIYKQGNIRSLRNVLSRLKTRNTSKNSEDVNDNGSPDSGSTDLKSPTTEKRSVLNPKSYSKNLLQRFKSIIGDEQPDDNVNKSDSKLKKVSLDDPNSKNDIKVVITSTETKALNSPTLATIESLSQSVFEPRTLTESENEKNKLDAISSSCCDITEKKDPRPSFEKSISMVSSVASSVSSSQTKSNTSSYQSLNKLPIYMQGSKHLGARIAQSEYADPSTLSPEKGTNKNVNVLINKNSVRPDSLFSNSSFITSSSEGTYHEVKRNGAKPAESEVKRVIKTNYEETTSMHSDESFYEKSFEKIEHITDDDVFRDSAVYTDQEDDDEKKTTDKGITKTVKRVESVERNSSVRSQKVTVTTSLTENKTVIQSRITVRRQSNKEDPKSESARPKIAPPVPTKPKITSIPTPNILHTKNVKTSTVDKRSDTTVESGSATIKRNTNLKQSFLRAQSTPDPEKSDLKTKPKSQTSDQVDSVHEKNQTELLKPTTSNIQLKRLSFERASLDSATRKTKIINSEVKSNESPETISKSVLERRMEIESLTKTTKPSQIRKPTQLSKPRLTAKVSSSETKEFKQINIDTQHIPNAKEQIADEDDSKGSWVKTVVNKFQ